MFKKLFTLILVGILFTFGFSAFAESYSFNNYYLSADFNENYTVILKDNIIKNEDIIKKIGHTTSSVSTFMENNNILFIAIGNENKTQIQLSCTQTEFSKKANSLSSLSEEAVASIGKTVFTDNFGIKKINSVTYIYHSEKNTVQYVTFEHKNIYTVTFYGISEQDSLELLQNIKIEKTSSGGTVTAYAVIISIIVIIILIATVTGIVLLTINIIKQIKEKSDDNDLQSEEIKIKRRKL